MSFNTLQRPKNKISTNILKTFSMVPDKNHAVLIRTSGRIPSVLIFCEPRFSLFALCDFYSNHVFHFNSLSVVFIQTAVFQNFTFRVLLRLSALRSFTPLCGFYLDYVFHEAWFLFSTPVVFIQVVILQKRTHDVFTPPMCTLCHHSTF